MQRTYLIIYQLYVVAHMVEHNSGMAMVAACKGYKLILTMPESMSMERRVVGYHLLCVSRNVGLLGSLEC